jgi:Phosphoribosyltransferase
MSESVHTPKADSNMAVASSSCLRLEPDARIEAGHRRMLEALGLPPLPDLGMRLGEGYGAHLAVNIVRSAGMPCQDGFAETGVSEK